MKKSSTEHKTAAVRINQLLPPNTMKYVAKSLVKRKALTSVTIVFLGLRFSQTQQTMSEKNKTSIV